MADTTAERREPGEGPKAGRSLTDAYRPIRLVGPPQAPVRGVLAAAGQRRVVLVDAVGAEQHVFSGCPEPPQHLLAPTDLVRGLDGHDLELPWCREPLARLLAARAAAGRQLAGGELVTLTVSLLRGTVEAWRDRPAAADAGPCGSWWADDDGRPLFAPDPAGEPIETAARAALEAAAAHTRDRVVLRHLEQAREALARPRGLGRALDTLEDALFEVCAPRPIARAPERHGEAPSSEADVRRGQEVRRGALTELMARLSDAPLVDTVADAIDRVRAGARGALRGGRRLPLLIGGGAALVVLVGGLMWPADAGSADAAPGSSESPPPRTPAVTSSPSAPAIGSSDLPVPPTAPEESPVSEEDPVRAVEQLLAELGECAARAAVSCSAVQEGAAADLGAEALEAAEGEREASLLDDYGDVAVVRVDDPTGERAPLIVQVVRLDGRWLLRAAHASVTDTDG
ncbi:hypothetical protein [Microbacterium marinilacus]|uniref:Uncharacterized protein n=1 Tax=Microbacterium marinilacus TaxID=415209 RepID=A0ABP7BH92_9MICO|nr:hypothetical protein [Microbacterium marinilacus]MBY0688459.1 hypothetical protein [Microbacterium marinilacus]